MKQIFTIFFILIGMGFCVASADRGDTLPQSNASKASEKKEFVALEKFAKWEVFMLKKSDEILCWASTPSIPIKGQKEKSLLLTTMRPLQNIRDEVGFYSPDNISSAHKIRAVIDKQAEFRFTSQGKWAWLSSNLDESRFTVASKYGNFVEVKFTDRMGKVKKRKFSLMGYSDAHQAAVGHCAEFYNDKER